MNRILASIVFLFLSWTVSFSQTNTLQVGGGEWSDNFRWSLGVAPTASHDVVIPSASPGTISTLGTLVCKSLTINSGGSLTFNGMNTLTVSQGVTINGSGRLTVDFNSTLTVGGTITVSNSSSRLNLYSGNITAAAYTINGGISDLSGTFSIGTGTLTSTGGTTFINSGGTFTSGTVNSSGTITVGGALNVGSNAISVTGGALTVDSGGSLNCGSFSSTSGNIVFDGTVDLGGGGTGNWTNGSATSLGGTITNLSTLTVNSSITVTSSAASISGGSITFGSGGNMTCSGVSPTITLTGNLTCFNASSFNTAGTSTIVFNGSSSVLNGGTGTGSTFYNITVNPTRSLSISNNINLEGTLTATGATFDADGASNTAVFTLLSGSGVSQASKIADLTGSTFSGRVTIQRYIPTNTSYQYLAFPVTDLVVSDIQPTFPVTGHYSSGSSNRAALDGVGTNEGESLFLWTASLQEWNGLGWDQGNTNTVSLSNTVGYAAYAYPGASGLPGNLILSNKTIARGNVNIPLNTGFNLIPNPYPSPISFNSFKSRAGLGSTVYLQVDNTGAGNSYASSDGVSACTNCSGSSFNKTNWLGEIAMGQSFWVSAAGPATLTLVETDKTLSSATFAGKTEEPQNYVRVSLVSGNMRDEAIINFSDRGSLQFASKVDALKRFNGSPVDGFNRSYINVSTYKGDPKNSLVFNYMPLLDCNGASSSSVVSLNVTDVAVGNHSLKFTDLETFAVGYKITLVDKFLSKELLITNGTEYPFVSTDDKASSGANRFELRFEAQTANTPSIKVEGTKLSSSASSFNQWYKDGKEIAGATGQTYVAAESGSYTVKAGYGKCAAQSLPSVLVITGLETLTEGTTLYPNPAEDVVHLVVSKEVRQTLSGVYMLDAKGNQVSSIVLNPSSDNTDIELNVSELPSGLYIVKLISNTNLKALKIIKK